MFEFQLPKFFFKCACVPHFLQRPDFLLLLGLELLHVSQLLLVVGVRSFVGLLVFEQLFNFRLLQSILQILLRLLSLQPLQPLFQHRILILPLPFNCQINYYRYWLFSFFVFYVDFVFRGFYGFGRGGGRWSFCFGSLPPSPPLFLFKSLGRNFRFKREHRRGFREFLRLYAAPSFLQRRR